MNKSILSILLLFILGIHIIPAQCSITLSDLENLSSLDSNGFQSAINIKGFSMHGMTHRPSFRYYKYRCDSWSSDSTNAEINCLVIPGKNIGIDYNTTDEQFYINLKDSLLIKGYIFSKEDIEDNNRRYYFVKGKIEVLIYCFDTFGKIFYHATINKLD